MLLESTEPKLLINEEILCIFEKQNPCCSKPCDIWTKPGESSRLRCFQKLLQNHFCKQSITSLKTLALVILTDGFDLNQFKQLKYFSMAHSGCTTSFLSQGGTPDRTKTHGGTVGFNSLKIAHECQFIMGREHLA